MQPASLGDGGKAGNLVHFIGYTIGLRAKNFFCLVSFFTVFRLPIYFYSIVLVKVLGIVLNSNSDGK